MNRSSRSVTLVLITCGVAALGFGLWNRGSHPGGATTRPYGHGGGFFGWWGRPFGGYSGAHNPGVSPSHTSRGGFGSTGHSVSS
jgi:hypothetical protein